MIGFTAIHRSSNREQVRTSACFPRIFSVLFVGIGFVGLAAGARAQVFTVGPDPIQSRYADIKRTHVDLGDKPLDEHTRQELIRVLDAEQGFAMRPLPKGSKGILLRANGPASPSGSDYVNALEKNGTAFQAADRVAITDVKIIGDKIIFELNGGPDKKHKFLRHVSVGVGGAEVPLARDDGIEPVGARVTLEFEKFIPQMTGQQVKDLLAPLIDFNTTSPAKAYTDTLPPALRDAILNHHVLVGMSQDMVLHALGRPDNKLREMDGQMPFEEWIYGEPPKDVQFVRFNGNRVIRVEEAKVGQPPIIRTENEMGDYWSTQPAPGPAIHEVKLGDADPKSSGEQTAQKAPPTLRKPGETLPSDQNQGSMQPVQFPKDMGKNDPQAQGQQPSQPSVQPAAKPSAQPNVNDDDDTPTTASNPVSHLNGKGN